MNQTKLESLIEAIVNTFVGFLVTITFLPLINWIIGVHMSPSQMGASTALFTIISVVRGYVIRRFFNNLYGLKSRLRKFLR